MGAATVKMTWKKQNITARNTSVPHTGCSSTRSILEVATDAHGALYCAESSTERIHPLSCASSPHGGGTRATGQSAAPPSSSRTSATPRPRWATVSTTGTPSARESAEMSTSPPRARSSSTMVSTTAVGRPSASASAHSPRDRYSVVESMTTRSASGAASLSSRPWRWSRTTSSSGLAGSREYVPGRSVTVTDPDGVRAVPRERVTVTPG